MKLSILGGGAWGTTLAQVLVDNGHEVLIYDVNPKAVLTINEHHHPFFGNEISYNIHATDNIKEIVDFSHYFVLSVPTKFVRPLLKSLNPLLHTPSVFINVSKGIEPDTLKRISEVVEEEVSSDHLRGFVVLTGPSHAEEVILRKLTLLVSSSKDESLAKEIQYIFANDKYLRIYTSSDLIGCEVGGAVKNAIAVISGACTGLGLGENARAAVITRGIVEIVRVVAIMGGKMETAFGLTGIGDLIVTASSENSRNFKAGRKIGLGMPLEEVYATEAQTIEGIRTIEAMHHLSLENNVELPMINTAYEIIFNGLPVEEGLQRLLSRDLKSEDF